MNLIPLLDSLRADTVFARRRLQKNKITSAAAILSLALSIGACISGFRLVDALLLRPLPIAAPDRLYALSRQSFPANEKPTTTDGWQYPVFLQLRAAVANRAALTAISYAEHAELTYHSAFEKAHVQYVSGNLFSSFGIRPALGDCSLQMTTSSPKVTPSPSS